MSLPPKLLEVLRHQHWPYRNSPVHPRETCKRSRDGGVINNLVCRRFLPEEQRATFCTKFTSLIASPTPTLTPHPLTSPNTPTQALPLLSVLLSAVAWDRRGTECPLSFFTGTFFLTYREERGKEKRENGEEKKEN